MNEDSELGVFVPLGCLIFLERLPLWSKRTFVRLAVDAFQNFLARAVIFADGFLPRAIDDLRTRVLREQSGEPCAEDDERQESSKKSETLGYMGQEDDLPMIHRCSSIQQCDSSRQKIFRAYEYK